ncbi:high-affinity branched-chain amino acid ABC transporter permease LivM [Tistrella bauzanensis]
MAMTTTTKTAAGPSPVGAALKDAGLAAFVALVIALPMLGLRTVAEGAVVVVEPRWSWVIIAVAVVFAGRLALSLWTGVRGPGAGRRNPANAGQGVARYLKAIGWGGAVVALVLPMLPFMDRTSVDLATLVLIYVMLGWGLNIVVGLAGLLDLGYVAFYAVGAYSYALLNAYFGWSFWVCLPLAGVFAASFGIALGYPVLRLRGDYLAIVTLGFGEIIRVVLLNWSWFTGGPNGVANIPRPSFFGFDFTRRPDEGEVAFHQLFGLDYSSEHRVVFLYYVILVLAMITNLVVLRLRKLPIGRAWEALREDEIACRSLGINPTNVKLSAFALGATFGGFAGAFFATRQGFISPESFVFTESAVILAIVVLGGMGSQVGVVLAAILLILLPELARDLQQFRMLFFGGAMVLIMIWRPRGLLAFREPTMQLSRLKSRLGLDGRYQ